MWIMRNYHVSGAFEKTFSADHLSTRERLWMLFMDSIWAGMNKGRLPTEFVVRHNGNSFFPTFNGYEMGPLVMNGMHSRDSLKDELVDRNHPLAPLFKDRMVLAGSMADLRVAVSPKNKPHPEIVPGSQGKNEEGTPTCAIRMVGGRGAPEAVIKRYAEMLKRAEERRQKQAEKQPANQPDKASANTGHDGGDAATLETHNK
ncbi:MAG: hypothetical protein H6925_00325 [Holosporaceae bacterium]|nr:MAG: hypothetical protein H6925_00325 [Holosporaceae bacterium]